MNHLLSMVEQFLSTKVVKKQKSERSTIIAGLLLLLSSTAIYGLSIECSFTCAEMNCSKETTAEIQRV